MKKLFLVFVIGSSLVACDNSAGGGDAAQQAKDSLDSITKLQKQSVEEAAQDAKQNLDSTNNAIKDSVDAAVKGSSDTTNR